MEWKNEGDNKMTSPEQINESDPPKEKSILSKIRENKGLIKIKSLVGRFVEIIIPPYAPKLDIDSILIPGEENKDSATILHFSEIQILLGMIFFLFGLGAIISGEGLLYILMIFGFVLVSTGFEIEEIYVTTKRLIVRRIGFIERIIRIPSDEEHLVEHIVSFNVGRAPMNKIMIFLGLVAFFTLLFAGEQGAMVQFLILQAAIIMSLFGLRLGKRILTLNFAGGHAVILGIRKGVPEHLLKSIMKSLYEVRELA